jgi:predicted TIM-barrel fold metal-dependent hydrolase
MIIDGYGHAGLPRFHSVADHRTMMTEHGITHAVLSAFDSSPDLAALHRAITEFPESIRALGIPLGRDDAEIGVAVAAQLAAGFSGLRLTDRDLAERPWLLDQVAEAGRIILVAGRCTAEPVARTLLRTLDQHPRSVIIGCHFAGGGVPAELSGGPVGELFRHPRFFVVFSRHGGHPAAAIEAWAEAVIATTGWSRLLWGSEAPVLFWRDETAATALAWIDRFAPTEEERAAFLGGNAHRLYFTEPVPVAPLELPFDPWQRRHQVPAQLWLHGLPVPQDLAGRLVQAWRRSDAGTVGEFAISLLDRSLPPSAGPEGR